MSIETWILLGILGIHGGAALWICVKLRPLFKRALTLMDSIDLSATRIADDVSDAAENAKIVSARTRSAIKVLGGHLDI